MKKSTFFITFAVIFTVVLNLLSLYSCSADDLEEDGIYTLASKTKRRTPESDANHSGNIVWGNVEKGTVIKSKTKEISDSFWGCIPHLPGLDQLYTYDVTYEGEILADTVGNTVYYSGTLFFYYYANNNYFSAEIENVSSNELYFKTMFRDGYIEDECDHYHTLFHNVNDISNDTIIVLE